MKIFDTSFKLNRQIALKNRDKDFKLPLRVNINSRNNNYTKGIVDISGQTFAEKVYVYKENTDKETLLDTDYISENFERDLRRYSCNLDIEMGVGISET